MVRSRYVVSCQRSESFFTSTAVLCSHLRISSLDDLDIHVITPGGFEIFFEAVIDPVSGGILDHDDIPEVNTLWVENIIFPLDGSAPRGSYTYFVVNYNQTDAADAWTLEVFLGDTLRATQNGVVAEGENATRFTFDF